MALKLDRPIVFFDLETTGTSITHDRIVEISIVKVYADGSPNREWVQRINPGMPIPAEATDIHHITDDDVKDAPKFADLAQKIADTFKGCDIAGFNSNRFDLPLLCEEMQRARVVFDLTGARLIDVQTIFHKKEPRTLTAAYRFYCDKNLDDAHSALADTKATCEVFFAQTERYGDLPQSIEGLAEFTSSKKNIDLTGHFIKNDKGEDTINFGRHKGKPIARFFQEGKAEALSYFDWILQGDFPANTKQVAIALKNKHNK